MLQVCNFIEKMMIIMGFGDAACCTFKHAQRGFLQTFPSTSSGRNLYNGLNNQPWRVPGCQHVDGQKLPQSTFRLWTHTQIVNDYHLRMDIDIFHHFASFHVPQF